MNRERAKELLPIIQAYADGEKIQILCRDTQWHDIVEPDEMSFLGENYRVKPKPREFKIMVMGDGYIHDISKQKQGFLGEIVKVREALE